MKTKGSVALHRLLQKWETCRGPCKYWRCFRYRYTWPKKGLRVTGWKNIPKHNKGLKNGSSEQNSIRQYLKILLSQVNLRKFVIRNLFGNLISYAIECGGIGGNEVNLAMVCLCKKKTVIVFLLQSDQVVYLKCNVFVLYLCIWYSEDCGLEASKPNSKPTEPWAAVNSEFRS